MNDLTAIRAQMDALTGFTAGPWYAHNQPGDWGLGGAHGIHVADANPYEWDQCIAHVEYQTPYCLGEKRSVIDAAETASANARLIAAAPDMHATILALCGALDAKRAENERLGRDLNMAKYGKPDFAWSTHLEVMADLRAENERLRKELTWYGEQSRLARIIHSEGDAGRHALQADGGNRARAALALKKE